MAFIRNAVNAGKIDVGYASNLRTHRIQDPESQMCPVWNGQDLAGRQSSEYGFYTKVEGCNSPLDRIAVENVLRPQYTNYVTMNAAGIGGYIYDKVLPGDGTGFYTRDVHNADLEKRAAITGTGHFGLASPAESISSYDVRDYVAATNGTLGNDMMAARSNMNRNTQRRVVGYNSQTRSDYGNGGNMISPYQYNGPVHSNNQVPSDYRSASYVRLHNL